MNKYREIGEKVSKIGHRATERAVKKLTPKTGKGDNCGIYVIISEEIKKCYVGQSKNAPVRLRSHKLSLEKGKYKGGPQGRMQKDYEKYRDSFEFKQVESCSEEELYDKENEVVSRYFNDGYHMYNAFIDQKVGFVQCPEKYHGIVREVIHLLDRGVVTEGELRKGLSQIG